MNDVVYPAGYMKVLEDRLLIKKFKNGELENVDLMLQEAQENGVIAVVVG